MTPVLVLLPLVDVVEQHRPALPTEAPVPSSADAAYLHSTKADETLCEEEEGGGRRDEPPSLRPAITLPARHVGRNPRELWGWRESTR